MSTGPVVVADEEFLPPLTRVAEVLATHRHRDTRKPGP
jgi:hypothetical protein